VVFNPLDNDNDIQEQLPRATSKLLQWFSLNERDPSARQWRYTDIPEYYVWSKADHAWQPRVQSRFSVARLPSVSGYNAELQALRMILSVARGAQSFTDILTVHGHIYSTFRDAAKAL
jgi:hypothetical protein